MNIENLDLGIKELVPFQFDGTDICYVSHFFRGYEFIVRRKSQDRYQSLIFKGDQIIKDFPIVNTLFFAIKNLDDEHMSMFVRRTLANKG